MKIGFIDFTRFRNNEHFQFHSEFRSLVVDQTAAKLKVATQFDHYVACYEKEDVSLQVIRMSAVTKEIKDSYKLRGRTFRGLARTNSAALLHYDPLMVMAAKRLKILFDTYGNIARMSLNEATSAIYNLLQELEGDYLVDMQQLSLTGWATALKAQNANVNALVKSRYDEKAARTDLKMVNTRLETDKAYGVIVTLINSRIIVDGPTVYEPFVRKLNAFINKYSIVVAQRQGRTNSPRLRPKPTS